MDIVLGFPLLNGGEEEGLNDAGIETFEGDIGHYVARECGQNSSDASLNDQVELHFNMLEMRTNDLPCIMNLRQIFTQCKEYWQNDTKAVSFFETGLDKLQKGVLPVLKVSDYGTTGLTGDDSDRVGKWFGLVRSKGASNKTEGAGGSFGIGKYAPFAASAFRTVYYYTRTEKNDAFQGISRLVTHYNDKMQRTQATGYIGHDIKDDLEQRFSSVRDRALILKHFLRPLNEYGTDIYIPAYRELDNWKEDLIISLLNSFWPALCLGKIKFKVGERVIDKTNIDTFIHEHRVNPDLIAYRYFRAYRNGEKYSQKLDHVGESELRLIIDDKRDSNPIAVARKSGMIIDTWGRFRSRKPISGIYICHDPLGNEVLRRLEPPRHDKWDPKRGENGKEVISTIREWIRSCIGKLIPSDVSESFDMDILSRFVPDNPEEDEGEEPFDQNNESTNNDGFEPTPAKPQKNITKAILQPKGTPTEEGQPVAVTEEGEGDSGGSGQGPGNGGGGQGGGGAEGGGNGGTGPKKENTFSVKTLKSRFIYNSSDSSYKMILRSTNVFDGDISFVAECDDGTFEPLKIEKIQWNGQEILLKHGGKSFAIKINPDTTEFFQLTFEQKEKMSLRIV